MPVEVKYWNRLEEYRQGQKEEKGRIDNEVDDIARSATPNEQTVQYMHVLNKNWGILTDGARWRLFNSDLSAEDAERFYEFNFMALYQSICTEETELDSKEIVEASKYFYHFFSKSAFSNSEGEPFVDKVLNYSKKYVNKVEEDLKNRFVKAMNIACNGYFKANSLSQDLTMIRNISESSLFNILFIKSLESRNVLPMNSTDYKKISLSSIIDKIEKFDPEKEDSLNIRELERAFKKGNGNSFTFTVNGTELHDRILRLTGVIHQGASNKDNFGFEIAGFRESIFSKEEWKVFKTCKLGNIDWVKILFELGYAESESLNRKFQQIPYAYFTPRQLGSIYESFLEFKLDKAEEDMVFEKKQWKPLDLKNRKLKVTNSPVVYKNSLFFTPDNEDRKASGSYYTPDHVVQYIVKNTIEPLVKNKSLNEILKIKVCDPAMGSGHFLTGALKYLSFVYMREQNNSETEIDKNEVKAKILANSIYGIDLNPRAIKLSKMSLWLETAYPNAKLEHLDEKFICKDSLTLNRCPFKNITLFLMNPPWVLKLQSDTDVEHTELYKSNFKSAEGFKKNLFPLFVEQVCKWSKENVDSSVGMVIPNRLFDTPSYAGAREELISTFNTVNIYKLAADTFENVTASSVAVILQNYKSKENSITLWNEEKTVNSKIDIDCLGEGSRFNLNADPATLKLVNKLNNNSIKLVDRFHCHVGMMVKNNKETFKTVANKKSPNKIVKGRILAPMNLKECFYFNYAEAEIFGGTKKLEKHSASPKLLLRKTGDTLLCSIDVDSASPTFAEQSVYLVIPKQVIEESVIVAVAAFINSSLATAYYRSELITNPDSYPYIQQYDLEKLPIPSLLFEKKIADSLTKNWKTSAPQKVISKVEEFIAKELGITEKKALAS